MTKVKKLSVAEIQERIASIGSQLKYPRRTSKQIKERLEELERTNSPW
jgi:uncharacterized small protein (DUF1192 family)